MNIGDSTTIFSRVFKKFKNSFLREKDSSLKIIYSSKCFVFNVVIHCAIYQHANTVNQLTRLVLKNLSTFKTLLREKGLYVLTGNLNTF